MTNGKTKTHLKLDRFALQVVQVTAEEDNLGTSSAIVNLPAVQHTHVISQWERLL